ncbi:MAG: sigma-70 family RNA polymerase sigma factor [Chloroflexota bacterium]|nr:sigma-70 family RNA polymerase sigma factor [Chloroflexota bacterium]MDE2894689.1 sigma-70 family RNA polymerase sigma factor [Chloroflexota bacterium]
MNRPGGPLDLGALDDDQLVAVSLDGRLDAFNVLVLRHQTRVRSTCRGIVGMADADDLMQESFIKAWDRLSTYKQRGKFPAWLGVIARRTCFDHLRQRQRRPTTSLDRLTDDLGDQFAPESGDRSLDDHLLNIELSGVLRDALDSLPEEQRRAVFYRDVADMEYREIADATGWSMGTVKSRISRGRSAMRDFLNARNTLKEKVPRSADR